MTGARVGGRIHLEQVRLTNEGGPALSARGLQAGQFLLEPAEPISGVVDLSHARIDVFRDDPVDLGMKHAFNPSGFGQWLSYVLVASGWIFVTTVAAAAARVLQRG